MNDPIGTRRPSRATSGLLLKAAVVIPDVLISSLLWLVIIAALPPVAGLALLIAGVTLGALFAAGLGEGAAIRVLYRARRATPAEAPRLTVAWRIGTHCLDVTGIRLRIVTHGPPITTAGRRHLLLRRDVVSAYYANEITAHAVADLITQGIGRLRHGHTRFDLLWTAWTIPWDFVRGLGHGIGRRLAWIPLVQLAWRTRFVVGSIAVVLEAQAGRWPSPIVIASFIGLSYLTPAWRRAWQRYLAEASRGRSVPPSTFDPTPTERLSGARLRRARTGAPDRCRSRAPRTSARTYWLPADGARLRRVSRTRGCRR